MGRYIRCIVAAVCCFLLFDIAQAQTRIYRYDNATTGAIPYHGNNNCATNLTRTFTVSDNFTVASVAIGLNITHNDRGDLRASLIAPNNAVLSLSTQNADSDNHFDILISANTVENPNGVDLNQLDDGDEDPVAEPYFNRLVTNTGSNFYSGNASGTWTLVICDRDNNSVNGTFNRAKLVLTSTQAVAFSTCGARMAFDWGSVADNTDFSTANVGGVTITETRASSLGGAGIAGNLRTEVGSTGNHAGFYQFFVDVVDNSGTEVESVGQLTEFTFSTAVNDLSFSILDNDWADDDFEDYTVIAGFDENGEYVPWQYSGGGSTQRAGDTIEGDAAAADNATGGNLDVAFARAVKRVQVEYLVGDDFDSDDFPDDQRTGISDFTFCAFDYGDAPGSYNVNLSGNGPRHALINRDLILGLIAPDGEVDGSGNVNANVDGADEDGIAAWPTYVASGMSCAGYNTTAGEYCATVSLSNNGAAAQLVGWIDFNGDGDFNDTGERSLPRLGAGVGGAADNTFTTANISADSGAQTRVLVWSGFGIPVSTSTASYGRIRLTTDASFFSDSSPEPNGLAADGEVEDYLLPAGTLPVSLGKVWSKRVPEGIHIEFETLAEAGNLGFDIRVDDTRRSALPSLIAADTSGLSGARYQAQIADHEVEQFWIDDIALDGARKTHGPFRVGQAHGSDFAGSEPIDWSALRAAAMASTPKQKSSTNRLLLGVSADGVYRIDFASLKREGLNLGHGVPTSSLGLSESGQVWPMHVADQGDGEFGPGDWLEFLGKRTLNRYDTHNWYALQLGGAQSRVQALTHQENARPIVVDSTYRIENDRQFNLSIPGDSPWVDERLLAYDKPVSLARTFVLPGMAPFSPIAVRVKVVGGTDLANPGPDHSVHVGLDGRYLADQTFDGASMATLAFAVDAGLLPGTHEINVELPADLGLPFDLVHLDAIDIDFRRYTHLSDGQFDGRFDAGQGFALTGGDVGTVIWAESPDGDVYRAEQTVAGALGIANPSPGQSLSWRAASLARIKTPTVARAASPAVVEASEFLVVAHPALMASARSYVDLQRQRGYRVRLLSTAAIYARYSDHEASAEAIAAMIRDTHALGGLRFVALLGADSYDYKNHLGLGAISFVPTNYLRTSAYIAQTPSDARFADVDDDGKPDLAIGRVPARSALELSLMISKLALLGERRIDQALFVSGSDSSKRFAGLSLDFATGLNARTRVDFANLDESSRADIRERTLTAFNLGLPLISYTGHTAPALWDFNGLLFSQDAATMINAGRPSLVTQWGCWNSFFVDPYAQSLSQQLLAAPGGAGTVYGATTLTEDSSHTLLGQLVFQAIGDGAETLGEAELIAKRRMAELRPAARDALLGMQILGDPALPIRSP